MTIFYCSLQGTSEKITLGIGGEVKEVGQSVISFLETPGALECILVTTASASTNSKAPTKMFFKKLSSHNILFYISFFESDNYIEWRLYEVDSGEFIRGKQYKKVHNLDTLVELIASTVWQELFSSRHSPFSLELLFLCQGVEKRFFEKEFEKGLEKGAQREAKKKYFSLVSERPFVPMARKKVLVKAYYPLVDLTIVESKGNFIITFSEITKKNVRIMKYGKKSLIPLIDFPGTASNICIFEGETWYILSGMLCRCVYDVSVKRFRHFVVDRGETGVYGGIAANKKGELFFVKNFHVYQANYQRGATINQGALVAVQPIASENGATGALSCQDDLIVTSERVAGYYQLVAYEGSERKRKVLTTSGYHKQDPSLSPCGSYIAYVAQEKGGGQSIEVMQRFTGEIKKIVAEEGNRYRSPAWMVRV